jgi:basic amino acid/polyamine antiporter, APA family
MPTRSVLKRVSLESVHAQVDTSAESSGLARSLSLSQLTLLGIGNTIGAGIFVLTGESAARYAGPGITLSYVLAGAVCLLTSLCYAEIGALMPSAGGAFSYARATLGRFPAWLIGWGMVMEYLMAASTVAVGWSGYAQDLLHQFGIALPRTLSAPPLQLINGHLSASGDIVNVPAVLMVVGCGWILLRGLSESSTANAWMVGIKVVVIIAVIAVGSRYVNTANWTPFIPPAHGLGHFGLSGIFTGSAVAFFAYSGFEAISAAARECRDPSRDLPRAFIAALVICVLLYVGIALVLTGLAPYWKLDTPSPVSTALELASPRLAWLVTVVNVGTVLGLGAAVLVALFGQARTFYSMAVVGFLPKGFARVHPAYRTPSVAIRYTGIGAAVVAGCVPIDVLGDLVSMGTLISFASVCLGVLILRRGRPEITRPFRVPGYPWVPLLGCASCIGLMFSLSRLTWLYTASWLTLGAGLYFVLPITRAIHSSGPVPASLVAPELDSAGAPAPAKEL